MRWGQGAFDDFKVVPPGTGIVHQVNIEYLASVVMARNGLAYPDTCVGTDSHTTMVNGLGVLGWGVGGIEAEAAMLGQPVSMLIPRVVGFKLTGEIKPGVTATDVVLTVTEKLRKHGVVGKFVEFYGKGVAEVPLANRATLGNMSPEFGSTAAIFPIDQETIDYLKFTGRKPEQVALVEAYAKEQGLWHDPEHEPVFSEYLELDLSEVVPSIAGPKRPQDRIVLSEKISGVDVSSKDSVNSFGARDTLKVGGDSYEIYRLDAVPGTEKLPYSLKVLAENLLRNEDGSNITKDHIEAIAQWDPKAEPSIEIQYTPARVVMQDFTGVPCIVDLATMREAIGESGRRRGEGQPVGPGGPGDRPLGDRGPVRHARRIRAQRRDRIRAQR